MENSTHDLDDFMRSISQEMAGDYRRIQKRVRQDPGTAGDQGEEDWAELLRRWLPPAYQVVTRGCILSVQGIASPQVDVLVLHPTYPRHLLGKKFYLAGGVAAAFECKLTLRPQHIRKAVSTAVEIRQHLPPRTGSPYRELHSPIIYGLLAHSHNWKRPKSSPLTRVHKNLWEAEDALVQHPRQMLDLLCVSDLGTWVSKKIAWIGPPMLDDWDAVAHIYGPHGSAVTTYICFERDLAAQREPFTPIGAMLSNLLRKLAWEDPHLRRLARYFYDIRLEGTGLGERMRRWSATIYSPQTGVHVASGQRLVSDQSWNEWNVWFI